MSEVEILKKDNETLKQKVAQSTQQIEGAIAQLEAHKGMLSEHINSNLMLRAQLSAMQKQFQTLSAEVQSKNGEITALQQQLANQPEKKI